MAAKTKPWKTLKDQISAVSRARVHETLRSMPLAEIRSAIGKTQVELAQLLGVAQGGVSKVEHSADMYLSTLRKYIEALGGELHLTVTFPDGRSMEIDHVSDIESRKAS